MPPRGTLVHDIPEGTLANGAPGGTLAYCAVESGVILG